MDIIRKKKKFSQHFLFNRKIYGKEVNIIQVIKIRINSITASFRQPLFISSFHPTYPIPPPSTIFGLLSAAKGEYVSDKDTKIGYIFSTEGMGQDLETIYEINYKKGKTSTNVYLREFLFNVSLDLYVTNLDLIKFLKNPFYPILLGRTNDIATIDEIKVVNIKPLKNGIVRNSLIPNNYQIQNGTLFKMPIIMSDSIPRNLIKSGMFYYVKTFNEINSADNLYQDEETGENFFLFP